VRSAPRSLVIPQKITPFRTVTITESLRTLRGRNRARLVKANDGRYFVQKIFEDASCSDRLFNEAFASQLGLVLGLPFARWSELVGGWSGGPGSSFGSELVSGDIFEYLPSSWYQNIQNRHDIFRCLLFDLWCNHTDPRQTIFRRQSPRVLHAYFVDHDQMFSTDDQGHLFKRIAKTRCLDSRIYSEPPATLVRDLHDLAYNISRLAKYGLEAVEMSVPISWGSFAHRRQVISGLKRRDEHLSAYIEAIMQFLRGLERSEPV
jgi:hypothetical protein